MVLYGDTREIHQRAILEARKLNIEVHVFEEGYLPPYWVTYERGGSNGNSRLMQMPLKQMQSDLTDYDLEAPMPPSHWGDTRQHVFYGALYHWFIMFANRAFPHFKPHRDLTVVQEFRLHLRRLLLLPVHAIERKLATTHIQRGGFPYHLVLLQLEHDSSLQNTSVTASNGNQDVFDAMLRTAKEDHPNHRIVTKTHPEAQAGLRRGYFSQNHCRDPNIHLYQKNCSPWALLDGAIAVYTLSSQFGFEAILHGHRPFIFGQPFYAGWGLSKDIAPPPRRNRKLNAEQLFMATMMIYSKWYDPYRDQLCYLERVLDTFEAITRSWREDRKGWQAHKIRMWKRKPMRQFFGQHARISFVSSMATAKHKTSDRKLVWSGSDSLNNTDVIRIEDGFLRSRGLGAELIPPLSLICDNFGIYYDPNQESRLERLIKSSAPLKEDQIDRAKRLQHSLINQQLTKYNLHGETPALPTGKRILVPGQVEDDASVKFGTQGIKTNIELLRNVRLNNPSDVIIYKPHPDVEARLRKGQIPVEQALLYADIIADSADIIHLLSEVNEVHTMTSLAGFEALLRGVRVTTYGIPFYAGWGLTTDMESVPERRTRHVELHSLIYAALIAYPCYFDPVTQQACPVEVVVDRLSESQALPRSRVNRLLAKAQGLLATPNPFWR